MHLPPPVGSTFSFDGGNDVDGKGVRLDVRRELMKTTLYGNGGYFNRLEAKSRGVAGELGRKRVVSVEQVFIGKETHPLADVDTDEPTDETQDDGVFSASRFVIKGRKLNWSAIKAHGDAISKVLGERAGEKGANINKDNLKKLYEMFDVDEDGVTSIKEARKRKVV